MSEPAGFSIPLVAAGFVSSLVLVWLAGRLFRSHATPYPPGPRGLPILGNALEIPPERNWLKFAEWAKDYGDVVHLTALSNHIIILSSQEAVNELLIKRGANNSNRPVLTMSYMCGWRNAFALLMYGDRLRTTKRITNNVLNQRACQRYIPIQQDTALRLVKKLFRGSDQVDKSLHWFSARILLKIVYDHEVAEDGEDELVLLNEEGNMQFSAAASPGWLVDIFPSLRYLPEWFPGAGFIRQARSWNKTAFAMYDVPFQMVKAAMATGTSHHQSHSLAATLLRGENGSVMSDEEEDIIRYATGSMYGAGGETTASALQTFFLVMVLNPEIQRLAQAEIDSVTGGDRFPTYDDRASLPYINALVKEVLRWQPAVPTGIPHCSTAEDHYRDWLIPAQTTIIVNIWQLLRDPKLYPDPHTFKPERFLDTALNKSNSALNSDPSTFVFGFGRRECPGRHLADASVFLAIATCLASFHISARRDSNGGPVLPKSTFSGGVISRPDELACVLKPRSAHAAKWLQAD